MTNKPKSVITANQTGFGPIAEVYDRYRPSYPLEMIDTLACYLGGLEGKQIADMGSGTGIFSEQLLLEGARVLGVEPDAQMQLAAKKRLKAHKEFKAVVHPASSTELAEHSIDLITAAQAYHWFDHKKCQIEWRRILKENGMVALIWNQRLIGSAFLKDYETLLVNSSKTYRYSDHRKNEALSKVCFGKNKFYKHSYPHLQSLNRDAFIGRALSASYAPQKGDSDHHAYCDALIELFERHSREGKVLIHYTSRLYIGKLV